MYMYIYIELAAIVIIEVLWLGNITHVAMDQTFLLGKWLVKYGTMI